MIESILLVDDEDLFHLVFEDACSLLDITLTLESINSADDAENLFKTKYKDINSRPTCVFVDLNIIGSSFDAVMNKMNKLRRLKLGRSFGLLNQMKLNLDWRSLKKTFLYTNKD